MNSPENKFSVFAGLDLGATDLKYGLVNAAGKILVSKKAPVKKGRQILAAQLQDAAAELFITASGKNWSVARIGVGSPGAVNFETGEVMGNSPNITGWVGVNLRKISDGLGVPVYADNDANCVALAEHLFGAARNCRSALCVTVGTGIGGGLILNGEVYRGSSFSAGEIGHITVVFEGEKCSCGNRGCLEKYVSVTALLKQAKENLVKNKKSGWKRFLENGKLTVGAIAAAAKMRDKTALELLSKQAAYLGAGLASAVNLINPEKLVLGGGFLDAYPEFLEMVKKEIRKRAFAAAVKSLKVVKAELGNEAGLVGAAFLGWEY